jgi:hypothetical protein
MFAYINSFYVKYSHLTVSRTSLKIQPQTRLLTGEGDVLTFYTGFYIVVPYEK